MAIIMIVDDELAIRRFLRISLQSEGHKVIEASSLAQAREQLDSHTPDVIVLDLGLPDGDGSDLLLEIRQLYTWPVIVLSVRENESEKVRLLDAGANDYLTKPFGIQEFIARINVLLRNSVASVAVQPMLHFLNNQLVLDPSTHQLTLNNQQISLSKKEYAFLYELLKHPGKVIIQSQLLRQIWGPTHIDDNHYLRIVVANVRRKLGDDAQHPKLIETLPGIGYRFIVPE
ncbi:response regulator [Celerinatantimonas diazotrophica]|uniref:Two-component system KDP operon response regulator KdpE n=1 Tax=Celerinatantimonas diazotrophica TaxID=412034 RepID=A0A4R1K1D4_9GAMM|nr:response regulator [Celerinatantimonas diazotrophica]TCK57762.1 two-component system KDP operon response regulator KdpE [Celerinatantimonas diazotrophica]CAG9298176.1 KDP operon transcriptional regulatory protein KdpE [Celerinatantimonas diazotrophica]